MPPVRHAEKGRHRSIAVTNGGCWTFLRRGVLSDCRFKSDASVVAMPVTLGKSSARYRTPISPQRRRGARLGLRPSSTTSGIALGGLPAASLARRLMLPVSRDTLLRVVRRRSMPSIRRALASSEVDPALLTSAERIQHDGFLRRQENNKIVSDLAKTGASINEVTRRTGRSRKLVRSVLRGQDSDIFRSRSSTLDDHFVRLGTVWEVR
jgi:hypothetical protein